MTQQLSLTETVGRALSVFGQGNVIDALDIIRNYPYTRAQSEVVGDVAAETMAIGEQYFYMLRLVVDNGLKFNFDDIDNRFRRLCRRLAYLDLENRNQAFGAARRFQRLRPEETLESLVSDYIAEADRLSTDASSLTDGRRRRTLERMATDIFDRLWTAEEIDDNVGRLIDSLLTDDTINQGHRVLWTHALGLNMAVDPLKLIDHGSGAARHLLALTDNETSVGYAALVWLSLISIYGRGDYVNNSIGQDIVYHTVFTEVVSVMSSDIGMTVDFQNLAGLFQGMTPGTIPDPESLTPEQLKGVEFVSQCAVRGDDIFRSVFGANRAYPFFATMANWFLPFDIEHSALAEVTDGLGVAIADNLAAIPGIVDGDKYAMLLSMSSMPAAYRNQAITAMVDGMARFTGDGMLDAVRRTDSPRLQIAAQVHMVSRFLLTSPWKADFSADMQQPIFDALPYKYLDYSILVPLARETAQRRSWTDTIRLIEHIDPHDITADLAESYLAAFAEMPSAANPAYAEEIVTDYAENSPDMLHALFKVVKHPSDALLTLAKKALENNPDHTGLVADVAAAYIGAYSLSEAVRVVERYIYLVDRPASEVLTLYGTALLRMERAAEVVRLYDKYSLPSGKIVTDAPYVAALWLSGEQRKALTVFGAISDADAHADKNEYFRQYVYALCHDVFPYENYSEYESLRVLPDAARYSDGINGYKL